MKLSNTVFVSTPFETNRGLPLDFPWLTFRNNKGVMLKLQGDLNDVHNLQQELEEVKKLVNKDVNKRGLRLRDLNIKIDFMEVI